jgi:salicylate hydroxylase
LKYIYPLPSFPGEAKIFSDAQDAYVLSCLLGSSLATRDTLPAVLLGYERVRAPRANQVIYRSRQARRAYEFLEEYDGSSPEEVAQVLNSLTGWLWEGRGEPEDDVREAERLIKELLTSELKI